LYDLVKVEEEPKRVTRQSLKPTTTSIKENQGNG
jgi:hypothetical protein